MSYPASPPRPKTSAGSRATSARGMRRPTTATRNINERPLSRTAMAAESNVVQRAVSRAAVPPPRSSMGERVQSRMGTAQAARPPTSSFNRTAPPGTPMRPVTQQGLTGVRAPSRLGTSRQVLDKSYYVSLLRQKSNSLFSEIEALKKELDRGERDQQNLIIYEKRAEEEASAIRDLQGRLIDCNMIVDRLNTNSDLSELQEELNELISKNDEAERSLNELFADRQRTEQAIREVEKQIEIEKAKNAAAINEMDVHIRDQFEELKQEAINLNEEYRMKQEELAELNRRKEQLDDEVANSTLKQQAMMLHERLAEMEAKKAAIIEEINAEGTPDEQRERLMQTVIRTTDEVTAMQKQIDSITERIDQGNEELREFESEYDGIIGEKNEKYRELKIKEMQIDEFLDSYEQLKSEQESRIAQSSAEIVHFLELISHNCSRTDIIANVTGMDVGSVDTFNDKSASATELQDLHVRLQEEMINLDESEQRLKEDVENFTQRMHEMSGKMDKFEDLDTLKAGTEQKRQGFEKRREELQAILPDIEGICKQVIAKLANAQAQLNDSDEYTTLRNVQKKWQYIEQNNAALREAAAARDAETNYTSLKEEAMRLQCEYNANLVSWTRPR